MALEKFNWQNGTQIEPAKVEIGGQSYNVSDAQYEGETPLSAGNLNLMQDTLLGNVVDNLNDDTKIPSVKAINNLNAYSTEEKIVGKWIDGKPIYRKVFTFVTPTNENDYIIDTNISDMGTVLSCNGGILRSNGSLTPIPFTMYISGVFYYTSARVHNNDIYYKGKSDYGNTSAFIILEYTKTTD